MSATARAEWHRRFRAFADTLRGCPVDGECAHCEGLITETICWLRGTDDREETARPHPVSLPTSGRLLTGPAG